MASGPDILKELPWLTPSPRKARKARVMRHARSALLLGVLAAPLLISNARFDTDRKGSTPETEVAPAVIDSPFAPKALRPLSPVEAEKWNKALPGMAAIKPATPFAIGSGNAQSLARSLQCMTAAIYYEAGNEPLEGQRAVAQVILNRMRSPVFPHSVCGVVYQGSERKTGCQFTFTCDGSLARVPAAASWARASAVAAAALGGYVYAPVGWATNYHADYVVPYWAQSLDKLTTIGRHIFYGWKGRSGTGAGFTSTYAGLEPEVAGSGLAVQQTATAVADPFGIVQVTSAERPMIGHTAQETPAQTAPTKGKAPAMEAAHPTVALEARWVIGGGPAGTSRIGTRAALPVVVPSARPGENLPVPKADSAQTQGAATGQ